MALLNSGFKKKLATLTLATGLIIVFLFYWLPTDDQTTTVESDTQIQGDHPDLFGTNITYNQLNDDGTLHYRLIADSIRQFDEDQTTKLEEPKLHLRSDTQRPWDITSSAGYIRKGTNQEGLPEDVVYLRDKVKMIQENLTNGTLTLRSEAFYLFPDRQYAETDQDVIIDTQVGRTTAGGMTADLESGVLRLSSSTTQRVHTIVLPEQFKKN